MTARSRRKRAKLKVRREKSARDFKLMMRGVIPPSLKNSLYNALLTLEGPAAKIMAADIVTTSIKNFVRCCLDSTK